MIDKVEGFKQACIECLDAFSLMQLRSYGRSIGVDVPTKKKKGELIDAIVAVLSGEVEPIERSTRGAPVKDDFVDPAIEQAIAKQRYVWFAKVEPHVRRTYFESAMKNPNMLIVQKSDNSMTYEQYYAQPLYAGQLEMLDGVPCLLPKNGSLDGDRLTVSIELIRQYGLREGDIIACHAFEKMGVWAAKNVLSINNIYAGTEQRFIYEEEPVSYAKKRISFTAKGEESALAKILDYTVPLGYGQRCLISSAPKAGKSTVLRDMAKILAKENRERIVFALLVEQSPELISAYQMFIDKENLVATTFDDEAERHVFAAEFLLKRAKRYAEMGNDVVLIVDSLSKIAKAYNETEDSAGGKTLPCGLESKTLHYIKKYFGAARCFASRGSLTIIATASFGTGDNADDVLYSELAHATNAEICLSDDLAKRRIFPAIDIRSSYSDGAEALLSETEREAELAFRSKVIPLQTAEETHAFVATSANFDDFYRKTKN